MGEGGSVSRWTPEGGRGLGLMCAACAQLELMRRNALAGPGRILKEQPCKRSIPLLSRFYSVSFTPGRDSWFQELTGFMHVSNWLNVSIKFNRYLLLINSVFDRLNVDTSESDKGSCY